MSAVAAPAVSDSRVVVADSGPFKFLDYFTEEEAASFDGRRRAIQKVVTGVLQGRTFVLYGGSGSGKTSLLCAGLFPALRQRGYLPVYARTLADPLADVRQAVRSAAPDGAGQGREDDGDDLRRLLERLAARRPVVLVLDQIEELFTRFRGTPEDRRAFAEALGELVADRRLELRLVFGLRQEYVVELEDFRENFPDIFEHEYRLRSLTAYGTRQAIASQLRHAAMPYEPRFLAAAVDLLEGTGFDPTILQIVCSEVYRRAAHRNPDDVRLTAADLRGIGSLELMFVGYLEELASDPDAASRLTARAVLDALITREGTRRALTFEAIAGAGFRVTADELEAVLSALVVCRLVRRERRGGERWYELVHERLVPVVEDWLKLDPEFFKFRLARNLVANSARGEAWRQSPEALLTPGQIREVVRPFRERLALAAGEREFLFRSAVHRKIREDALYWAGQLADETDAGELLAGLLASGSAAVRRGAATAARWFPDAALNGRCARLAIGDPDSGVRRAAADSLAAVGPSRQEVADLAVALADPQARDAAAEALVSLRLARRPLPALGLRWPRIAWLARQRVVREQPEVLRRAARAGARRGSWAAAAWVPIGVLGVFLLDWSNGGRLLGADTPGWFWLLALLGVALPSALAFGALAGSRLAVTLAQKRLLHQKRSWFRLVGLSRTVPVLPVFALALALVLWLWSTVELGLGRIFLTVLLGSGVLLLAVAGLVHLNGLAVAPAVRRGRTRVWLWALISSCGLPVLLPFLVAMIPWWIRPEGFWKWTLWIHVAALPLSFFCFVLTLSLARPRATDEGAGQARRRRALLRLALRRPAVLGAWIQRTATRAWLRVAADRSERWRLGSRGLALGSIAVGLAGSLAIFGPETVPFLAPTHDLEAEPIEGRLGFGFPDADYVRLDAGAAPLTVVEVAPELVQGWQLGIAGRPPAEAAPGDSVLVLPAGRTTLAVTPADGDASPTVRYRLDPRPRTLIDPAVPVRLPRDRWSFAACELGGESAEPEEGDAAAVEAGGGGEVVPPGPPGGAEGCVLRGRLPAGSWDPGEGVEVVLFAESPNRAADRDLDVRLRLWRIDEDEVSEEIGEGALTRRAAFQALPVDRDPRRIVPIREDGVWQAIVERIDGAGGPARGLWVGAGLRLAPVAGDAEEVVAAEAPAAGPPAPPPAAPRPPPPARTAAAAAPLYPGGDVEPPRRISGDEPEYPRLARRRGIRGAVRLQLVIDEEGAVADVSVLRGLPLGLTREAERAVRTWRYEPATRDGRPVKVHWTVEVHFGSPDRR